jgi:hypothetical protein
VAQVGVGKSWPRIFADERGSSKLDLACELLGASLKPENTMGTKNTEESGVEEWLMQVGCRLPGARSFAPETRRSG